MFLPGSRYESARLFTALPGRPVPFPGVRPREIPPTPGVIEHTVRASDRLDALAGHFYDDDRLWWRIVDANPEFFYGGDLVRDEAAGSPPALPASMVGRTIVIPRAQG